MNTRKNPSNPIINAIIVMIMVFLASGCNTPVQTLPAITDGQGQSAPTKTPKKANTPLPAKTPLITETPLPTNNPNPDSTPVPDALGLSRRNPYPGSKVVSAPNWDIQVLEVKRGEAAWQDIQAADTFNEAAPEGMEYLLVKLHVKSTYTDGDEHSISGCDFSVTGDHLINYTCGMAVELVPSLEATLSTGEETEGWATYFIAQGEKKLILVFQELFSLDENAIRYIALDDGASIKIPPDLANIKPTDLGITQNDPAPRAEKLTTRDWVLSVNDVVRGDDAWTMVQEASQFNDPPAEGMEYIAVKIHVRYIVNVDKAGSMDGSFFSSTGSAGVLYELPSLAEPAPELDISLFPGGEYEGWIVVQAAQGETGVMLVFKPLFDTGTENQRFILLEQ